MCITRYLLNLIMLSLILSISNAIAAEKYQCALKNIRYEVPANLTYLQNDNKNSIKKGSSINQIKTVNQRGCCSWHQGVCGCSNGRAVCCDGTYSPSCGCW